VTQWPHLRLQTLNDRLGRNVWSHRLFKMGSENILIWNVRGLNARLHRDAVRELVRAERPSIVCFQETKLGVIFDFDVIQIVGAGFDYCYLPAVGTHGGILVAWRSSVWSVSSSMCHTFSVSISIKHNSQDQA
jgi:exonuclease III